MLNTRSHKFAGIRDWPSDPWISWQVYKHLSHSHAVVSAWKARDHDKSSKLDKLKSEDRLPLKLPLCFMTIYFPIIWHRSCYILNYGISQTQLLGRHASSAKTCAHLWFSYGILMTATIIVLFTLSCDHLPSWILGSPTFSACEMFVSNRTDWALQKKSINSKLQS